MLCNSIILAAFLIFGQDLIPSPAPITDVDAAGGEVVQAFKVQYQQEGTKLAEPYYADPTVSSEYPFADEPMNQGEWMPEMLSLHTAQPFCNDDKMPLDGLDGAPFLVEYEADEDQGLRPASLSLVGNSAFGAEQITAGNRWVKVPYQPFEFNVVLPVGENPDTVRFWLNGLPADPEMLTLSSAWAAIDRRTLTANFQWQCPSLGKVVLQVEYLRDEIWSPLSRPLRIEVLPPSVPQPIAAGALETGLFLMTNHTQSVECLNNIVVKFANLTPGATVVADIAGIGHVQGSDQQNCCYEFDLKSILPVGRYKLTFRQVDAKHCGLSSRSSTPIVVDLSYDPYAEVAIENTKSFRRYAMLRNTEHLVGESYHLELVWMQRLMREPSLRRPVSTSSATTWLYELLELLRPKPLVGSSVPSGPTGPTGPMAQQNGVGAKRFVSTVPNLTNPPSPRLEPPKKIEISDRKALMSRIELWNRRSLQSQELSNDLESIESSQDAIQNNFKTSKFVSKIDFDTPTVFASGRKLYSSDGAVAGDLTILEGMRVSVAANGTYRVEFRYIAPQTPAILHLQLQVRSDETSGWKTLTLAPIAVKPINYDEPDTMVHQVIRDGYSSALERVGGYINQARRRGSAVSGYYISGPAESAQF